MKVLVVFLALVAFGACQDTGDKLTCSNGVKLACGTGGISDLANCNAKYGGITHVVEDLQKFANSHIAQSFDYLLMSSYFGKYTNNRAGFERMFRKLSDTMWNDAIEIIKHIAKRGGSMDLKKLSSQDEKSVTTTHELTELESLSRALDAHKNLAHEANRIHGEAGRHQDRLHDPEIASYLENNFVHKHADSIRELSGHSNDLGHLLEKGEDKSLVLFLFDEYLQKL